MTIFKNANILHFTFAQIFEDTLNYGDVNSTMIPFEESVEHFN